MSAALETILAQVLELPECDEDAAAILRAYQGGDRSAELVERTRDRFRAGPSSQIAASEHPSAAVLAVGWTINAVQGALAGDARSRDMALRHAQQALDEAVVEPAESTRPTIPDINPDDVDTEPGWEADPAGQPGGRI